MADRSRGRRPMRVVVKVGTAVLSSPRGALSLAAVRRISSQIARVRKQGHDVVLVSSGAIGAGMSQLGLRERPRTIPLEQASAAVGQGLLMRAYGDAFRRFSLGVGQVLLTQADLRDRRRYINVRNTLSELLGRGIVPIVNENDTVAVDELAFGDRFGDNDTLSALVANLAEADLLVVLSDVDGFFAPAPGGKRVLVSRIERVTPEVEAQAGRSSSRAGKGGMVTKLKAARIVTSSGMAMVIANGKKTDILLKVLAGEKVGTFFAPVGERIGSRKRWIAFTLQPRGAIVVDGGARAAREKGNRSLLPSGIVRVSGKFETGDAVSIRSSRGREFARGLTNYSSAELDKIRGARTGAIVSILGYKYHDEAVHRDSLVILAG